MPLQSLTSPSIASVVIDTNVVLDWLVFRNPGCAPFVGALLGEGRVAESTLPAAA